MLKKIALSSLILFLVCAFIFYFFGSSILGKSIKTIVESVGPKVTKTSVSLDSVKLSILSGDGRMSGLYVGNPEGFSSENIFALGQIDLDLEPRTFASDEIVISKIHIKEPYISYEKTLKTSNLKELLRNIEESTGDGEDSTSEVEEQKTKEVVKETEGPGKTILIKEFIIENPKVSLSLLGVKSTITLPSINQTNISSSEEQLASTITKLFIKELFDGINSKTTGITGSINDGAGDILNLGNKPIKGIEEGLKNLLGK